MAGEGETEGVDDAPPPFVEDVTQAPVLELLQMTKDAGEIHDGMHELLKGKYEQLHALVLKAREREGELQQEGKTLQQELLSLKIKLEKESIRKAEEATVNASLGKEKNKAVKELEECIERDQFLSFETGQLSKEAGDLRRQLADMQQANADLVEPQFKSVRDEVSALEERLQKAVAAEKLELQRRAEFEARLKQLADERVALEEDKVANRQKLGKIKGDPKRIEKNTEVVTKAVDNYSTDVKRLEQRIVDHDNEIEHQQKKRREGGDVGKDLGRKLDLHSETIRQREADVANVERNLKLEKQRGHEKLERRAELELEQRAVADDMKHELERLALIKSDFEKQKKMVKKRRQVVDSLAATIPQLRLQVADAKGQVQLYQSEASALNKQVSAVKQEVDVYIAKFLTQEQVEKGKMEELKAMQQVTAAQERDISLWTAEEHKAQKTVAMLSAQREVKAREAAKASQNEKETKEQLKIKELMINDLSKSCTEANNRLKEFSALYDVVKNERNKYVNLIQASSQALAEMKEKIKILENEVEILRNESLSKDKGLTREASEHVAAQKQRDALRLETNRCQALYRQKQELVEQQIVEIDKLNSIINATEKQMVVLKKQYEQSVDTRNFTGVQLINQNDQLCIQYEHCNVQEQTLKKGTIAIREKEDMIAILQRELAELQRTIEASRKRMPQMPQFAEQILQLQQELAMEREMTEMLCRDLETPENVDRWRELGGEDPDLEQLQSKIAVISERLNDKKEQLLEKELVLEEVTNLSEQLRAKAGKGRGEALELAKKVNDFQSKIKDTTRKMMATVSELSMYQATAMKLQQEKHDREVELEDAQWHLEHGEPPTEAAEQEWQRMQRDKLRRREEALQRTAEQSVAAGPAQVTRTTAEPRPNAYIPDELGIPRPYGALAPFKPTEAGATMRHIRNPQPKEIEI